MKSSITISQRIESNQNSQEQYVVRPSVPSRLHDIITRMFECHVCKVFGSSRTLVKQPILLPCKIKICQSHLESQLVRRIDSSFESTTSTSTDYGNSNSISNRDESRFKRDNVTLVNCPNEKCTSTLRCHELPSKLSDWCVETSESTELLELLELQLKLDERLNVFKTRLNELILVMRMPNDCLQSMDASLKYFTRQLGNYVDFYLTSHMDTSFVMLDENNNDRTMPTVGVDESIALDIRKSRMLIEELSRLKSSNLFKMSKRYLSNCLVLVNTFIDKLNKHLGDLKMQNRMNETNRFLLDASIRDIESSLSSMVAKFQAAVGGVSSQNVSSKTAAVISLICQVTAHRALPITCLSIDRVGESIVYTGSNDSLIRKYLLSEQEGLVQISELSEHTAGIIKLAMNTSSSLMASLDADHNAIVWTLSNDTKIGLFKRVFDFEFSPDLSDSAISFFLIYENDLKNQPCLRFWAYERASLRSLPTYNAMFHTKSKVTCLSFSKINSFLLVGLSNGTIELYSIDKKPTKLWQKRLSENSLGFPIRRIEFANSQDRYAIWNENDLGIIFNHVENPMFPRLLEPSRNPQKIDHVAWSCNDKYLFTVYEHVIIVRTSSDGQLVHKLTNHTNTIKMIRPHPMCYDMLLSVGLDRKIVVWNIENGIILAQLDHLNADEHDCFFIDTRWVSVNKLMTADLNGNLRVYKLTFNSDQRLNNSVNTNEADLLMELSCLEDLSKDNLTLADKSCADHSSSSSSSLLSSPSSPKFALSSNPKSSDQKTGSFHFTNSVSFDFNDNEIDSIEF